MIVKAGPMRSGWFFLLCTSAMVGGCADDDEAICGEPADRYQLDAASQDHTCEHVDGPFGDLAAASASASDGPELVNEHMFYTVTLPADGGSFRGVVTFRPSFTGVYAFHLGADVPLRITARDDGAEPCAASRQAVGGCDELVVASLHDLEGGRFYRLELGPATEPTLSVVAEEHLPSP